MSVRTRRWNDPKQPGDGHRVLVSRYRPRALKKEDETWDVWIPALGPSKALHAAWYGKKTGEGAITLEEYVPRYLDEMRAQRDRIYALALRVRRGEAVTLLCSTACVDPARCHRTLLAKLVEDAVTEAANPTMLRR